VATWTQADIDKLRAAVLALAAGESVLTVNYGGPPSRSVTYRSTDLPQMRSLLAEMTREVSSAPTHRLVQWNKGFR
jgi:hypothetical protein